MWGHTLPSLLPPSRPLERGTSNPTGACSQHVTNAGPFPGVACYDAPLHRHIAGIPLLQLAMCCVLVSLLRFYCLLNKFPNQPPALHTTWLYREFYGPRLTTPYCVRRSVIGFHWSQASHSFCS